jgi:diguanylate cyclase (GGDEF)-like protein
MGSSLAAFAQSFTFKEYGQAQGLDNLTIRGVIQGRGGFLWISTENGIFRYDGSRFVEYGRKQGLANPFITTAHIDARGILWAGTSSGVYYMRNDRFEPLVGANVDLDMDDNSAIVSMPSGEVLIKAIHRLYSVEPNGDSWSVMPYSARHNTFPDNIKVYGLMPASDGSIWLGCDRSICHVTATGVEQMTPAEGVPSDNYFALKQDSAGKIWARGENHILQRPTNTPRFHSVAQGFVFDPRDTSNAALIEDPGGRILTPDAHGIARWNGKSWMIFDTSHGLPDPNISQLLVDNEGIVWVASHGRGLFKWLGYDEWEHWSTGQGIRNPAIFAMALDQNRRMWVGNGNTIDVSDNVHHTFRPFAGVLPPRLIALQSAASDTDGSLWFGDYSGVLLHVHPKTETYETITVPRGVHQIYADSSGTLWVITSKGLYKVPPAVNGRRRSELVEDPVLKGVTMRDITEAPDHSLWLGTMDGLFHLTTGSWRHVQLHNPDLGNSFSIVAAGPDQELWVAGKFGGVARLRVKDNIVGAVQIVTVPTLSSENVNGIRVDSRGWVWVTNDHGVDILQAGRWRHYDRDEGLLWNDTNEGAVLIDQDGSAWIGTSAGLSHLIHPDAPLEVRPLTTSITDASWAGHALTPGQPAKFPWQSGDLMVNFAVFSFRNENAVSFHYRLLGLEDDWVTTHDHSARYPKLPPGHYKFEVIAEDSGLRRWSQPATLSFDVKPPWWRTPAAWLALGCIVLVIGALILRWRLRRLLGMQKRLERLVAERTHALQAERRELLATREVLRQQATRDGLTGLLNRTAILEVLNREWKRAEREHTGLAVIITDVDHFKRFNDTFGHLVGDEILNVIAGRLRDGVREYDSVGRYGGEEFLIVLTGWSPETGEERLNRLWETVCGPPVRIGSHTAIVTSSFGVAGFPARERAIPVNDLLIGADQALYRAKARGRNRIEVASPVQQDSIPGPVGK